MKERIGFIGLGAMGLPMMRNLLKNGYAVTAYDVAPARIQEAVAGGAKAARSCKEVAEQSHVTILVVPTAADTKTAIFGPDGVQAGVRDGATVIEMSTIDADTIEDIAASLAEKHVDVLGAPVVRGVKGATTGTLAIYVGGDRKVLDRCRPILSCMGKEIIFCGKVGTGNTVKLVNNMIVGVTMCLLSEAMVLGVKAGVSPDVLFDSLTAGSANSFVLQNHVKNHVLIGDFSEEMFSIDYEMKDLALALATADKFKLPQTFGALAYQTYEQARANGLAKKFYPAVIELAERLAGVKVRTNRLASDQPVPWN